jgi:Fe-S cluster assembly protein SufD
MSATAHSASPATAAAAGAAPQSAALRSFEAQWHARRAGPLHALRESAMQRFVQLGLPTMRDETWRYTNLRALAAHAYVDAAGDAPAAALQSDSLRSPALRIVNGVPCAADRARLLENGLEIMPLSELLRGDPVLLRGFLEPLSDADQQRWALLNTALFVDGLYIRITASLAAPLRLVHVTAGPGAAHPRVIIEAAPGSAATIVEEHVSHGDADSLCNSVTQIAAGAGAEIEHYRIFRGGPRAAHIDTLDIRQAGGSRCKQFTICLGGALLRTNLEARLEAAGASLDSYALLVGHGSRHADCVNIATHSAPDTRSRQTARIIASGDSRVIFNSKVIVCTGAVRSESMQSCRGLLMSPAAEIDTRPQLEIHTDEVKCAHGATTGRLDPDMLFYMLSRGLDRRTAQSLLVYAFLADVMTDMSPAAGRDSIDSALLAQLPESDLLRGLR